MAKIERDGKIKEKTALTIGFFDGVHLGHRHLISKVCEEAKRRGLKSAVLTFDKHPREVLGRKYQPKLITTLEEKEKVMSEIDILDYCIVEKFTKETAELTAKEFMHRLKEQYGVKMLAVGYDHRFGKDRLDTFENYVRYGKDMGIEVVCEDAEKTKGEEGKEISSTLIRKCLEEGNITEANRCLGRNYFIIGEVVEGYRLGRTIGFPTANIKVKSEKLLPADGVYAVRVEIKGESKDGMLYIGNRPTVNTGAKSIEVNIFDFDSNIYGEKIEIEFISRIREDIRFDGVEELKKRLDTDKEEAIRMLNLSA